jgi:hypothetical protein
VKMRANKIPRKEIGSEQKKKEKGGESEII